MFSPGNCFEDSFHEGNCKILAKCNLGKGIGDLCLDSPEQKEEQMQEEKESRMSVPRGWLFVLWDNPRIRVTYTQASTQ